MTYRGIHRARAAPDAHPWVCESGLPLCAAILLWPWCSEVVPEAQCQATTGAGRSSLATLAVQDEEAQAPRAEASEESRLPQLET